MAAGPCSSGGSARRRELDSLFAKYGVAPVAALEADDRGNWLGPVRAGLASLLWYRGMADQAVRAGLVVRPLDPSIRRVIASSSEAILALAAMA